MLVYQRVNDGYCHVWLLEGNKILNSKEPNRTGSPFQDDFSSKGQELHLYGQDIILWCHTSCTMQGWQRRFAAFLFQMVCIYIYITCQKWNLCTWPKFRVILVLHVFPELELTVPWLPKYTAAPQHDIDQQMGQVQSAVQAGRGCFLNSPLLLESPSHADKLGKVRYPLVI
jgi:hypothetical protein